MSAAHTSVIHATEDAMNGTKAKPSTTYKATRLLFKADVIEAIGDNDKFRIETPHGTFEMTKAQFYPDFGNVPTTTSYREGRIYHYPKTPKRAEKYLV